MRHTVVLLFAFISGGVVSSPAWIRPLLPSDYAAILDAWTTAIAQPETYWRLAGVCVFGGVLLATFLAWNEERDEVQKLTSQIHDSKPVLSAHSPGWTYANEPLTAVAYQTAPMLMLKFHIEIVNGGADTSLRGWQGGYRIADNRRIFLSNAMFDRSVSSVVG